MNNYRSKKLYTLIIGIFSVLFLLSVSQAYGLGEKWKAAKKPAIPTPKGILPALAAKDAKKKKVPGLEEEEGAAIPPKKGITITGSGSNAGVIIPSGLSMSASGSTF